VAWQAHKTSTIETGLKQLTKQVIDKFRSVIGCDRCALMYNDASSEELVFFLDDQCIRSGARADYRYSS
jgi:hypothetical protein